MPTDSERKHVGQVLGRDTVDAVLFDLDGTLMDTDDQAVAALARRLRKMRWPHPDQTARRVIMATETPGNLLLTLADTVGLDAPLTALSGRLCHWRGLRAPGNFDIIDGIEGMLAELDGRYCMAVVTTRDLCSAEAFLTQYNLGACFDAVVTSESTRRLKPHPAPIRHAARLLGVQSERCVMVGDTTVDIKAARRAGAWAVGVLCGFGEREELERAGAHAVLDHTAELTSLV
jgi:beta-phosphoglucomutase-like phosphatase (HAD superfamily)